MAEQITAGGVAKAVGGAIGVGRALAARLYFGFTDSDQEPTSRDSVVALSLNVPYALLLLYNNHIPAHDSKYKKH